MKSCRGWHCNERLPETNVNSSRRRAKERAAVKSIEEIEADRKLEAKDGVAVLAEHLVRLKSHERVKGDLTYNV